jgi:hypothetical protein
MVRCRCYFGARLILWRFSRTWRRRRAGFVAEAGRDPSKLKLIVTANVYFHPAPLGEDRPIFVGSAEQIEEDYRRYSPTGRGRTDLQRPILSGCRLD